MQLSYEELLAARERARAQELALRVAARPASEPDSFDGLVSARLQAESNLASLRAKQAEDRLATSSSRLSAASHSGE